MDGSLLLSDDVVTLLSRERLIQPDSESRYSAPVPLFVVICGSQLDTERTKQTDAPLIQALQQAKHTVVACEPQEVAVSDFLSYRLLNLELLQIERVDTDMGECALVFALRGEKLFSGTGENAK